jgi:hypothetical protein
MFRGRMDRAGAGMRRIREIAEKGVCVAACEKQRENEHVGGAKLAFQAVASSKKIRKWAEMSVPTG